MNRRIERLLCLGLLATLLTGCASESRTFPGNTPDQVWVAVLAVARSPDYSDPLNPTNQWTIVRNNTWVEESNRRVEIFRELRRELQGEGGQPVNQFREWKFTVTVRPTNPPRVDFKIRNDHLPAHGWREEERFFNDLGRLLSRPEPDSDAAKP